MESSKRYLLQAEIEYWHEMLCLNQSRINKNIEVEMRDCPPNYLKVQLLFALVGRRKILN